MKLEYYDNESLIDDLVALAYLRAHGDALTTVKLLRDWTGLSLHDAAKAVEQAGVAEIIEETLPPLPLSLDELRAVLIRQIKEYAS
jgi:hypothetical protein